MNQGKYCRIHFRVKAEALLGQTIGVSGSVSTLGNFDTKKFVQLVTTPESYPVWYTLEPVVVPKGRKVSYCFCIIESGRFKSFEDATRPRFFVPTEADVLLEEEFSANKKANDSVEEDELVSGIAKGMRTDSSDSLHSLDSMAERTIYITCYHLPVTVVRSQHDGKSTFTISWNHSLISMKSGSLFYTLHKFWIGTVSVPGERLTPEEEDELRRLLGAMRCIPLFLDDKLIKAAYYGYCKQVLWPTFHNIEQIDHMHAVWRCEKTRDAEPGPAQEEAILQFWDLLSKEEEWYAAYRDVTRSFADKIKSIAAAGDIVWVHDYHLMLLPGMLREGPHPLRIVFFLHIPFPTSQVRPPDPSPSLLVLLPLCSGGVWWDATYSLLMRIMMMSLSILSCYGILILLVLLLILVLYNVLGLECLHSYLWGGTVCVCIDCFFLLLFLSRLYSRC